MKTAHVGVYIFCLEFAAAFKNTMSKYANKIHFSLLVLLAVFAENSNEWNFFYFEYKEEELETQTNNEIKIYCFFSEIMKRSQASKQKYGNSSNLNRTFFSTSPFFSFFLFLFRLFACKVSFIYSVLFINELFFIIIILKHFLTQNVR
jgi:hypothetical protein